MRMPILTKTLLSTAVAATLSLGMVSQAAAVPGVFEVTPAGLGVAFAGYTPFNADQIFGNSSVLIQATSATDSTGTGWINFSAFALNGTSYFAGTTGLNLGGASSYGLYLTFTETSTITNGLPFGSPGSTGNLTSLNYTLWADPGSNNAFTQANATTPTAATVTVNGTDIKLATGSLISGVAGINGGGGAHFNATNTFALTPAGELVFTQPVPFFDIAFNEFNNTQQGVTFNPTLGLVAITQETGSVDFNRVPEPASIALVGLGLLGFAASRRKNAA